MIDTIMTLLNEGMQLCMEGALDQAEFVLMRLLAMREDVPDAWNLLAMTLFNRGRIDEAGRAAERATRFAGHVPQFWLTRGNIAQACGRRDEAEQCFGQAVQLDATLLEAHWALAINRHEAQRFDEAVTAYRAALQLAPAHAGIHHQLAQALGAAGRWNEAIVAFENAFAHDPQYQLDRRSAIDAFEHLEFQTMPSFWRAEIARFYARDDIDRVRYSRIVLRMLCAEPAFRAAREGAADAAFTAAVPALQAIARDETFALLLADALIADPALERWLTQLRAALLEDAALRSALPVAFLAAFALQCVNNEYVYAESAGESNAVDALGQWLEEQLHAGAASTAAFEASLCVYALYRPLTTSRAADALARLTPADATLQLLLRRALHEPRTERALRGGFAAIGAITDATSTAVRGMYEQHPYPRWLSLDRRPPLPFADWMRLQVPVLPPALALPATPRILVAGCGTGRDAIGLAAEIRDARVLAIDLSLTSLSYAQRRAQELGLTNIEFRHADLLNLGALEERFDVVYSAGVLHHLSDPDAGFRVLRGLVRDGGLMSVALYSLRGRSAERAGRREIARRALQPTTEGIRAFRQALLDARPQPPLGQLLDYVDFYSTSMCRDLLFHVQEHEYDLPGIASVLAAHRLALVGLVDLAPATLAAYRRAFPDDPQFTNLEHWHAFEAAHPGSFGAMYQFWSVAAATV